MSDQNDSVEVDLKGSVIERLNKEFAMIAVGNKMAVAEFGDDGQIVEFWPFEEFRKKLIKREYPYIDANGKPKKMPLADAWLRSPWGKQYKRLVYAMPGSLETERQGDYNGWQGFRVKEKAGDWSKNRAFVLELVCGGNEQMFQWVMNWFAGVVQLPGQRAFSALVLLGPPGGGKGHLAVNMLGSLFHKQQFVHLIGSSQLTGAFNEHLSGKVLVFADEATWGGDRSAQNTLKGLVTESTVPINRKYLKQVDEPNAMHIIIASNDSFPLFLDHKDRRYCVLDLRHEKLNDEEYFAELRRELNNGGREAFLDDLLKWPLDEAMLRHPPSSEAKDDMKSRALNVAEKWLQDWLMNDDGRWTNRVQRNLFYESYCKAFIGSREVSTSKEGMGRFLHSVFRDGGRKGWPKQTKIDGENGYNFPSLNACREVFDRAMGFKSRWPESDLPLYPDTDPEL